MGASNHTGRRIRMKGTPRYAAQVNCSPWSGDNRFSTISRREAAVTTHQSLMTVSREPCKTLTVQCCKPLICAN